MHKIYKFFTVLICFILIVFIITKINKPKDELLDKLFVVGLHSGYPPFEFINSQGDIVGFDVDVARCIAKKMGKTLVIKNVEFEGLILLLKQGKLDAIISGMNITESRLREILMVPYYGQITSLSLLFWGKIPDGVVSIEDIAKFSHSTITVQAATEQESYMKRYHPEIHVRSFQSQLTALMDVKYGKAIATLTDPAVAQYEIRQHPELKTVDVPLPKEENILGLGIGIKKDNQELFQKISIVISELKSSGELGKLVEKWF